VIAQIDRAHLLSTRGPDHAGGGEGSGASDASALAGGSSLPEYAGGGEGSGASDASALAGGNSPPEPAEIDTDADADRVA